MSKRLALSAVLVAALALPALGQSQQQPAQRAPGAAVKPAPSPGMTNSGNVQCPATLTATVSPSGGWSGGNHTATLFNLSAMDGSRTDCIYSFEYVTISKPAPAGTKCTVAPDNKSFNCK